MAKATDASATGDSKPTDASGIGHPIPALKSVVEILTEKKAIYAAHPGLFASELAAVDAAINREVFNAGVGKALDRLKVTAITGICNNGVWTFSRVRRVTDAATAATSKANPGARARLYNGTLYASAKALCESLGYPVKGDSAVRVLARNSIAWRDLPAKVV